MIDRPALLAHRARATRNALFLHEDTAFEVQERLNEVNKSFTRVAIVTAFPEPWREIFPQALIVPDDETLALQEGAQDLVIHALALHQANDPVGQLVQCRRALAPDGLLIAACFGGQTLAELRAVLAEAEIAVTGGLSPRVLPMGEIRDLGGLLGRVGLALPVADAVLRRVSYRDGLHLMQDLRAMGETNALMGRIKHFTRRAVLLDAIRRYGESFSEEGRVMASFEVIYLTGWAPHESQQKPLKPGSAQMRLAEALDAARAPSISPLKED